MSDALLETDFDFGRAEVELLEAAYRTFRVELDKFCHANASWRPALPLVGERAKPLPGHLLEDARLFTDRIAMLQIFPKRGIGAEVGTQTGAFASELMRATKAKRLHLIDLRYELFRSELFFRYRNRVILHTGLSWEVMERMPDETFDWIYIDAGHDYDSVSRDIAASVRKLKPGAILAFNDYTNWSPLEFVPYGVMAAVNDLLVRSEGKFVVAGFAFHPYGYHDICLRSQP
jgi:Methyltransferase domain